MWRAKLQGMRRLHGLHPAPDGRWLAVGGPDGGRLAWAAWLAPGAAPGYRILADSAYAVAPDFGRLLTVSDDPASDWDRGVWWDLRHAEPSAKDTLPADPRPGHTLVLAVAYAPGGLAVAAVELHVPQPDGKRTPALVVRTAASWAERARSADLGGVYGGVCWHPSGERLAVFGGREAGPGVWLLAADGRPDPGPFPWMGKVHAAAFSPCGRHLAVAAGRRVLLVPGDGGQAGMCLGVGSVKSAAVAFAPDGRLLTAGTDGVVRTWDVAAGREVGQFALGLGPLHALAVAPDGLTAAAGGPNAVAVWDL